MTLLATYAPRVAVHGDRYGGVKSHGPNLWIVLHTSEQSGEHTESAERLANYMTSPGDRPNGRGGYYGSSYHAVFDTDRVLPCVPYNTVAYSAGGGNSRGIHGCFPGKAGQTRAEWLDDISLAQIRVAAKWIVDVSRSEGIPAEFINYSRVAAYDAGVCDHHAITLAFRRSTHTDVGPSFPWDVLRQEIDALLRPPPPIIPELPGDPTMWPDAYRIVTFTKEPFGAFLVGPGGVVHLDAGLRDAYVAAGVKSYKSTNDDVHASYTRVARGLSAGPSTPGDGFPSDGL